MILSERRVDNCVEILSETKNTYNKEF